jgi:hypothetical protein
MDLYEQRRQAQPNPSAGSQAAGGGCSGEVQAAREFYHAADEAISSALSTDSQLFNLNVEQEVGQ